MDLTFSMRKVLCDLRLGEENNATYEAIQAQKLVATELVNTYLEFHEDIIFDKWDYKRYYKMSYYADPNHPKFLNPERDTKNPSVYLHKPTLAKTRTFYTSVKWFNRIYRLANWLSIDLLVFIGGFVKYFGINHGTVLLFDLSVISKHIFNHMFRSTNNPNDKYKLTWKKFANLLMKGDRPVRMTKSFLWLTTNILLIVLTGGFSVYLNLCMLTLDAASSYLLKRNKLKTSNKARIIIKNNDKYQALTPFLEKELRFQKNKNLIIHSLAMVIIGLAVILLPQVFIPIIIGYAMISAGLLAAAYSTCKLIYYDYHTLFDRFFKSIFGVSKNIKSHVENSPQPEQALELGDAKQSVVKVIDGYKKQCSILNFYGIKRANELIKKVEFVKNTDYLRDELAIFLKTGRTESDSARYNFFRSLHRRSGKGVSSLRSSIFSNFYQTSLEHKDDPKYKGRIHEVLKNNSQQIAEKICFNRK